MPSPLSPLNQQLHPFQFIQSFCRAIDDELSVQSLKILFLFDEKWKNFIFSKPILIFEYGASKGERRK